jgi:peptidoglycan/LPS O-acetylase OafA/YrhL
MVVVLYHFGSTSSGLMDAHTAVKVFFMISGFYMAMIIHQKYGHEPAGRRAFAINRFLRLYPLYAVLLILTISWYLVRVALIGGNTPEPGILAMSENLGWWQIVLIWLSNLSLLGLDFVCSWSWVADGLVFLPALGASESTSTSLVTTVWVVQAWSISMEILFYLSAPFLARCRTRTLIAVIACSLGLDLWISLGLGRLTYFFAPAQWYLFVAGMVSYRVYDGFDVGGWAARQQRRATTIAVVLFVATWSTPFLIGHGSQWTVLIGSVITIPILFAISKKAVWDRAVGNLSYPIYLSHLFTGQVLGVVLHRVGLGEGMIALLLPMGCILVAIGLHYVVERPIEGVRSAVSARLLGT